MSMTTRNLYETFEAVEKMISSYPAMQAAFKPVATQFNDKMNANELNIMVYGIYNAGKSTLINALLGEEAAPTGDVPLTSKVTAYQWQQYRLLDTPGVDAPAAHEEVTRAQMLTADAIIFVVNPSGAAEEHKTLQKLIDLLAEKKKLFLVFNEKNPLSLEDFTRLKDNTRSRLQELAAARDMQGILQDIPILRVNAARALKGRLSKQPPLVSLSGYPELESALHDFINTISDDDVNQRLAKALSTFLDGFLEKLHQAGSSEAVRQYDQLLKNLVAHQSACRVEINKEIDRSGQYILERSKSAMLQDPQNSQRVVEQIYQEASTRVCRTLEDELGHLNSHFRDEIENLEATLNSERLRQGRVDFTSPAGSYEDGNRSGLFAEVDGAMIKQAATSLSGMAKPEHITASLKLVKEWLPSLMKGIGPKTMEKWGVLVVSKWIPYAGTAITVLTSLWGIIADDPSDKKMREQSEKMERERERFKQEVSDIANDLSAKFKTAMNEFIRGELEPFFNDMVEKVESALGIASEQDKAVSATTMEVQRLNQRLQNH